MIGNHVAYEDVESVMEEASAADLDRRWESLTTNMTETETRVAQLRTQQGQLSQEMKQLGEDSRLTVAQLELGCIERRIETAARRWQTLSMASCLLEDVCSTFERERQPETLREASTFLSQLTDGKYTRVWTPLGTNQLKIGDAENKSIPLEVLSRGTREAVFIALRLSLAAAYSRRGVMLPLVLDDVLVNFDRDRAICAARTLQTFAELGHQVMMFTCHQHIVDMFHDIEVQVRMMPGQGTPGRATILEPEPEQEDQEEEIVDEEENIDEPLAEEPVIQRITEVLTEETDEQEPAPLNVPDRAPDFIDAEQTQRQDSKVEHIKIAHQESPPSPTLGRAWFEDESNASDSVERLGEVEDALASISGSDWRENDLLQSPDDVPEEIWNRNSSWWGDSAPAPPTSRTISDQ
jgi:hypothetical protein